MATHSSIPAWRIPEMTEDFGLFPDSLLSKLPVWSLPPPEALVFHLRFSGSRGCPSPLLPFT